MTNRTAPQTLRSSAPTATARSTDDTPRAQHLAKIGRVERDLTHAKRLTVILLGSLVIVGGATVNAAGWGLVLGACLTVFLGLGLVFTLGDWRNLVRLHEDLDAQWPC